MATGNGNGGAHKGIGDRIRETLGLGTAAPGDDVPTGSTKVTGGKGQYLVLDGMPETFWVLPRRHLSCLMMVYLC